MRGHNPTYRIYFMQKIKPGSRIRMLAKDLSNQFFPPPSRLPSRQKIWLPSSSPPFSFPNSSPSFLSARLFMESESKNNGHTPPSRQRCQCINEKRKKGQYPLFLPPSIDSTIQIITPKKLGLDMTRMVVSAFDPTRRKSGRSGRRLEMGFGIPHHSQVPKS